MTTNDEFDPLDRVVAWLREVVAAPMDGKFVPGASEAERRQLAALGGLVAGLLPARVTQSWPPDILNWLEAGPRAPKGVILAAKEALRDDPDGVLANLYADVVCAENRRPLGTFFTPAQEVQLMLDMWGDQDRPATVVDVGAGVGVFTALAARKWPQAQIYAVDINPVTLGLLGVRISGALPIIRASARKPGIRLVRDDYVSWISHHGEETPAPRLILGNPPYTRAQLLPLEDRIRLGELSDGLCGTRSSLSTLMTAISLRHLGPEDGLCLLLPAQWLESHYAQPLRDYLARLSRRRIELRLVDSWRFPDAQVDAVALLVGPQRSEEQPFHVATWRSETPRAVRRGSLVGTHWRNLFEPKFEPASPTGCSVLQDYCAVRRGVATGANEFFILNEAKVIEYRIPARRLLRLARRIGHLGNRLDDKAFDSQEDSEKRWLLNVTTGQRVPGSAVDNYLKLGEQLGYDDRYLCKKRKESWYDLGHDLVIPDVIVGPMTRGSVRVVENLAGCAIANNLYGWQWDPEVPSATRKRLLRWLRSEPGQQALLGSARSQGDGLIKIEPRALAALPIPAHVATPPRSLS